MPPKKAINQKQFNEAVYDNIDEFMMDENEAVEAAVSMYESMGINLDNIQKKFFPRGEDGTSEKPALEIHLEAIEKEFADIAENNTTGWSESSQRILDVLIKLHQCVVTPSLGGIPDPALAICKKEVVHWIIIFLQYQCSPLETEIQRSAAIISTDLLVSLLRQQPDYLTVPPSESGGMMPLGSTGQMCLPHPQRYQTSLDGYKREKAEVDAVHVHDRASYPVRLLFLLRGMQEMLRSSLAQSNLRNQGERLLEIVTILSLLISAISASITKHETNRRLFTGYGIVDAVRSLYADIHDMAIAETTQLPSLVISQTVTNCKRVPPSFAFFHAYLSLIQSLSTDDDIRSVAGSGFENVSALFKEGVIDQLTISLLRTFRQYNSTDQPSFLYPRYPAESPAQTLLSLQSEDANLVPLVSLHSSLAHTLSSLAMNKDICLAIHGSELTIHLSTFVDEADVFVSSLSDSPLLIPRLGLIHEHLLLLQSLTHLDDIKLFYTNDCDGRIVVPLVSIIRTLSRPASVSHPLFTSTLNKILNAATSLLSILFLRNPNLSNSVASGFLSTKLTPPADFVSTFLSALQTLTDFPHSQSLLSATIRNAVVRCADLKEIFLSSGAENVVRVVYDRYKNAPTEGKTRKEQKQAASAAESAKSCLRDLGCDVEFTELWTGKGLGLKRE